MEHASEASGGESAATLAQQFARLKKDTEKDLHTVRLEPKPH